MDHDLAKWKHGLQRFCALAHSMVQDRIGEASLETIKIETIFPRNRPMALMDNSFYVGIMINQPRLKLQKELTKVAHAVEARNWKESCEKIGNGRGMDLSHG